jgi:hypothetical protein
MITLIMNRENEKKGIFPVYFIQEGGLVYKCLGIQN